MKKMILILLASTTYAALPPLAQSTREIQAILADSQFYSSLGSAEMIKEIIRTEKGYLVVTQHYSMHVDIKYGGHSEPRVIGPARFELEFQKPIKLSEEANAFPSSFVDQALSN